MIFLNIQLLEIITAVDSKAEEEKKYFLCWLITNKPQPSLFSGDFSIQGSLSLVLRVYPEYRFHGSCISWSWINDVIKHAFRRTASLAIANLLETTKLDCEQSHNLFNVSGVGRASGESRETRA